MQNTAASYEISRPALASGDARSCWPWASARPSSSPRRSHHGRHLPHLLLPRPQRHPRASFPRTSTASPRCCYLFWRSRNPGRAGPPTPSPSPPPKSPFVLTTIGLATGMLWARPHLGHLVDVGRAPDHLSPALAALCQLRSAAPMSSQADRPTSSPPCLPSLPRSTSRSASCPSAGGARSIPRPVFDERPGRLDPHAPRRASGTSLAGPCGQPSCSASATRSSAAASARRSASSL